MRFFKKVKFVSLLLSVFVFGFAGCKNEENKAIMPIASGRATIELSVVLPTDDFKDILYVGFKDVANDKNTFTLTLSPANGYAMMLSIPTGEYVTTKVWLQSGKECYIDLAGFLIPEEKTYMIQSNVSYSPITTTVYDNNAGSALTIVFLVVGIALAVFLAVLLIKAKIAEGDEAEENNDASGEGGY